MTEADWSRICVVCSARGRETKLEAGHCCAGCAKRIDGDLAAIVQFGDLAAVDGPAASTGTGGGGFESKPPVGLDGLAPYLAVVNIGTEAVPTRARIDIVLAAWERHVREDRGWSWYGDATAHHIGTDEALLAAQAVRQAVGILRASLEWITTEPTFPLEDFASEVDACARRMRAFGSSGRGRDRVVRCPTIVEADPQAAGDEQWTSCGAPLTIRTWAALSDDRSIGQDVHCRSCGATRSVTQLLHAAQADSAWADAEDLAGHFRVPARTIRKWAAKGLVRRQRGLFSWSDVREQATTARLTAYETLKRAITGG